MQESLLRQGDRQYDDSIICSYHHAHKQGPQFSMENFAKFCGPDRKLSKFCGSLWSPITGLTAVQLLTAGTVWSYCNK